MRSAQVTLWFAPQGGTFLTANLALMIGLFGLGLCDAICRELKCQPGDVIEWTREAQQS
jgi:hypothetical protein